jgi:WD40 repeat protein
MPSPRGWPIVPADASRRFLVAAGTEHYQGVEELASVPEDLRKMAGFFGRLGYYEQLPEVRLDPTSAALRTALSEWLNGPDRQASDTAVIYYSGHGDSQADSFYLLTSDTKEDQYAATALPADYVLRALGENPKVRRVLLILDACYAGQGAFDAADLAARMAPWQSISGDDEGVWVVAAASPKQEAQERLFTDAFLEAAEQLQQTTGTLQPYIGLETLIWQINAILRRSGKQQRASWIPATQARGLAPFIPNARYEPDAPANVDLETREWLRRRHAAELAEYWGAKARGVEVAGQAGWYFTGRQAALAELTGWLADHAADTRLRVLTGDPGSGKSAVLGRLVTLADTTLAPKPPGTPADPSSMPPAGSITAALLAKGKTADELLAELAASLGAAHSAEFTDTLRSRSAFTVVIDALDEAADPPAVVEKVISPLHGVASPGHGPRLLIATRRYQHLLGSLPATRVTIDLDQDTYRNDADVADYVTKVLLAADDPELPTPYRDQPELAHLVASQVAAIAGHSFLIAQIAARTLARTPRVLDPAEVSADREQWRDVGAAFDRDLDRYGEEAHRVRDLLTPLAWAQGAGLPRELWAPLVTVLADNETYTQADIGWLIERAGFYLVETLDQDRSVYRLYHEQFAEHLRAVRSLSTTHERITAELLRHVPAVADGRREWLAAVPYIRTHLATHAAKARMLDQLVNDPGFLLAADRARLLPALATVTDPEARKSASAFESTHYLLPGQSPGQAAAQLDLAAHVHRAAVLTDRISHLPYQRPWTITWGHWARRDRHILLGRHTGKVQAVATAILDGTPVAVTGGGDGTVRVWDLRTGEARGEPLAGHTGAVSAVAVGEVDGTPVAVTGGGDGTVRVWDLPTGEARGEPLVGKSGFFRGVTALATGEVDGTPVAVTGGRDGTVRVWDLRTGEARGEPLQSTHEVKGVAVGKVDGTPVAVATDGHDTVRVWDLRTAEERGKRLRDYTYGPYWVYGVAVSEVDGTPVAVTTGGVADGRVRVWDLRTGEVRGKPLRGHTGGVWDLQTGEVRGEPEPLRGHIGGVYGVAVGEVDGTPVAVTGGGDGTVRVWDLRTGTARGEPLRGHTGAVSAVAVAEVDGTPVAVTGGGDGTVRVWDLPTGEARGEPLPGDTGAVSAVAVAEVDGTPVAVTGGGDGTVRVWDLRTGTARGEPLRGHTYMVSRVAVAEVDGTPVAVTGGLDGTVRVWDLPTGKARGKPLHGQDAFFWGKLFWGVTAVATGEVDGTPVAVIGERRRVRVWDLRTGKARGKPLRGHHYRVSGVAVGEVDGTPVAVTGDLGGRVRVWDLRTGKARGKPLRGHTGAVSAVATGEVDGTPVAVTGGADGTVRVWDLPTGEARGEPLRGHTGAVSAVAVAVVDGTPVAVTGGADGTILMRDLDRDQRASARLYTPAGITAVAYAGQIGWLTATADGSIFIWRQHRTSA